MLQFLAAVLLTVASSGKAVTNVTSVSSNNSSNNSIDVEIPFQHRALHSEDNVDGFQRNSVNVASCADSNIVGSSGSYW